MASKGLGTLTLDLVARIGGFEKGLDKAARHADKRMKDIEARARKFGAALGVAMAAGAAAAGTALVAMTKQAIDAADRLNDISQRLGIGTEALSAWGYAAQQSGTDLEALNTGLVRFTKNVAAAMDEGSRQGEIFAALGVSITDAAGNLRTVESLLPEVAQAFAGMENATLEAALAQELFGRSGTDLLQLLNLGADGLAEMEARARDLGLVISQDTASAADEFNDQLANLEALAKGAGLQLAQELLPAMTQLVVAMREALQEGQPLAKLIEFVGDQADAAAADFEFFAGTIRDLTNMFGGLYDGAKATLGVLQGIRDLDWDKIKESVREGMEADERIADGFLSRDPVRRTGPAPTTGLEGMFPIPGTQPAWSAVPLTPVAPSQSGGGSTAALMKVFAGNVDEVAKSVGRSSRAVRDNTAAMRENILAMTDFDRQQIALEESRKEWADALEDLTAQLAGPDAEALLAYRRNLAEVEAAHKRGAISTEDLAKWQAALGEEFKRTTQALGEQVEAIDQTALFWEDARFAAEDTFASILDGSKSARDAVDDLAAAITRMAAQKVVQDFFGALFGTPSYGGAEAAGSIFDLFAGSGFGFSSGGYTGPGGVNDPAGIVHRGEVVWSQDDIARFGGVANVEALRRGGGGAFQQTNNIVIQGAPDRRTQEQIERAAGRGARRALARTGG